MSGKISGLVWDLKLPHSELFVLLAITDHADHDGNNMHPSLDLLAWKTGYTKRSIIRILNKLVERGVLTRTIRPGHPSMYSANLDAAPRKPARPNKRRTRDKTTRDNLSPVTEKRFSEVVRSDTPSAKNGAEPSEREPSEGGAPPLTDQQKAVRLLAQFHEAKTGAMVAGWARRDMDALIEDFPLARLEAAIAATGDQPMAKPFLYLRKVLASADLLPAPPPARPAGRSDAAGNGTGWQLVEAFVSIGRPADQVSEAAQAMWSSYKVRQDAAQLARLGATPEDVKALVQSKMADGRDGYSFRFLVTDMVEWKAARPPVVERMYFTAPDEPAPRMTDAERAALKLQIAAVRRESAS